MSIELTPNPNRRLLRLPEVIRRAGISRSEIYRREKKGTFPRKLRVSRRVTAWVEAEIDAWIELAIAQRTAITVFSER